MEKKQELFDLTIPQKNMLQIEKQKTNKYNHILVTYERDNQQTNAKDLERAINNVIKNNDNLRARLIEEDGEVKQYYKEYQYQDFVVDKVDDIDIYLRDLNEKELEFFGELSEFNLVESKNKIYTVYKTHHILNDAWGAWEVATQIEKELEKNRKKGNDNLNNESLEEEQHQYKEFIKKEKEYLESKRYQRDKEFWSEYVKKLSPDKMYNRDIFDVKAKRIIKVLDKKLFNEISNYCSNNKISESAFFLAVIAIYYNKILSKKSLNIGTPFLNRSKEDLKTIGLYITNLPLNIQIKRGQNFNELAREIYSETISIFRRSKFPYTEIQKLNREINDSTNLYEVGYSYQIKGIEDEGENHKGSRQKEEAKGVGRWYFSNAQDNPIIIHMAQTGSKLEIMYDYLIHVIDEEDIESMHKIILHIIKQILDAGSENRDINISEINVLDKEAKKEIKKFNDTGNASVQAVTINELLEIVYKKHSKKTAIKIGDKQLSYKELERKTNELALILRERGVKRNTPVMLLFEKSFEMIISMIAIIKAGGCYIPVLPDENISRIEYIIKDANPKLILTTQRHENKISANNIILVNSEKLVDETVEKLEDINNPDDLIYIIYTSGSTGVPKGVKLMHKNVHSIFYSMQRNKTLKPTHKDVSMSLLKYSFDASGIDIYSALLAGGTLVLISKEDELDAKKVVEIMEKEKVTRSFLVPKWIEHINNMAKENKVDLSNLKILGSGGEPLQPKVTEYLHSKYPKLNIINLYGPTEATMFATYKVIGDKEIETNETTIGRPTDMTRAYIVNEQNEILPIGKEGELILAEDSVSVKTLAQGYLNLEEFTNGKFIEIDNMVINEPNKIYKTGDMAKINKDLEIEFLGRRDDVVKINNGYLVSINEVESKIKEFLGPKYGVCVIPINVNTTKTLILALETDEKHDLRQLKKEINSSISFYMRVKDIIIFEKFPVNNSGKIHKKEIKEKYLQKSEFKEVILPRTETEKEIYKIIKFHSGLEEFSIEDDFIDDLNIDSLDLSVISAGINNPNLKMQDLYTYTTVESLAEYLENAEKKKGKTSNINIKVENNVKKFDMTNVFLLGSTGFLGIHMLAELAKNKNVKKIYTVIREKKGKSPEERLDEKLNFYFDDEKLKKKIRKKTNILKGDVSREQFGLTDEEYEMLKKNITTVINSAANVSHYGKYKDFYKTNVESVKKIIEFCGTDKSFSQISTLSVAGFKGEETEDKVFDENTLDIGQVFNNNPYLETKLEAEKIILTSKTNAKIFRLGNIMPRVSDGKFQENYTQSAFINSFRLIKNINKIAESYLGLFVEFSPVDETAKSIVGLTELNTKNKIFHIVNDNEIEIKEVLKIFSREEGLEVVEDMEFVLALQNYKEVGSEYFKEYIMQNNTNKYDVKQTKEDMEKIKFKWFIPDKKYLKNMKKIIEQNWNV